MTGRELYHLWCTPDHQEMGTEVKTDRARYFDSMNPGDQRSWDRLAAHLAKSELSSEAKGEGTQLCESPWRRMRRILPMPPHFASMPTDKPDEVWTNEEYEVFVHYANEDNDRKGIVWLSVKRMDREAIHDWRHLQQIKNEVCGKFREGVELYPGEHRIADNANQYHMWVFPDGFQVPLGFEGGMVLVRPDEVDAFNNADHPGRQRHMQPGLTIGQSIDNARLPEQDKQIRSMLGIPKGD